MAVFTLINNAIRTACVNCKPAAVLSPDPPPDDVEIEPTIGGQGGGVYYIPGGLSGRDTQCCCPNPECDVYLTIPEEESTYKVSVEAIGCENSWFNDAPELDVPAYTFRLGFVGQAPVIVVATSTAFKTGDDGIIENIWKGAGTNIFGGFVFYFFNPYYRVEYVDYYDNCGRPRRKLTSIGVDWLTRADNVLYAGSGGPSAGCNTNMWWKPRTTTVEEIEFPGDDEFPGFTFKTCVEQEAENFTKLEPWHVPIAVNPFDPLSPTRFSG